MDSPLTHSFTPSAILPTSGVTAEESRVYLQCRLSNLETASMTEGAARFYQGNSFDDPGSIGATHRTLLKGKSLMASINIWVFRAIDYNGF